MSDYEKICKGFMNAERLLGGLEKFEVKVQFENGKSPVITFFAMSPFMDTVMNLDEFASLTRRSLAIISEKRLFQLRAAELYKLGETEDSIRNLIIDALQSVKIKEQNNQRKHKELTF